MVHTGMGVDQVGKIVTFKGFLNDPADILAALGFVVGIDYYEAPGCGDSRRVGHNS